MIAEQANRSIMQEPVTTDDIELITLPDGTELDARQSLCAHLHVLSDLTREQIAQQCGYAGYGSVSKFLASKTGQEATRAVLISRLSEAGRLGLQTAMTLAREAKREDVRLQAARDLMDRAQLKLAQPKREPEPPQAGDRGNAPQIVFNLPAGTEMKQVEPVEHEENPPAEISHGNPPEGGRGKK